MNYLTNKNLIEAVKYLSKKDKDLNNIYLKDGIPPLWVRKPGFITLIKIILEQQVSLASAKAAIKKLKQNIIPFTPDNFIKLNETYLRSLGLTRQKSSYCISVAEAFKNNIIPASFSGFSDEEIKKILLQIKGIGSWSADIYLLMALRKPDIYPEGDIALAKSIKKVKRLRIIPSHYKQLKIAENWKPYRSVAAKLLWNHYIKNKL